MESELFNVINILRLSFKSASNIYIDPNTKVCEVTLEVDDYHGELEGYLVGNGVSLKMIDYSDIYPFKYVFSYKSDDNFQFI
jgi:hypothetical protein